MIWARWVFDDAYLLAVDAVAQGRCLGVLCDPSVMLLDGEVVFEHTALVLDLLAHAASLEDHFNGWLSSI